MRRQRDGLRELANQLGGIAPNGLGRFLLDRHIHTTDLLCSVGETIWDSDLPIGYADDLVAVQTIENDLLLTFGETIGTLRRTDQSASGDGRHGLPRGMTILPTSSADKIRGTLLYLERAFEDDTGVACPPESIISYLSSSIGALTKRNWPADFDRPGREGGLKNILLNRLRTGKDRERRFAATALNLYDNYRNPNQHDFDSFRCTWLEAMHFYTGIRMLLELSDEIAARQN